MNRKGQLGSLDIDDYHKRVIESGSELMLNQSLRDRKALSIMYLALDESSNYDEETSIVHEIQKSTYNAYHFTPVLEFSGLQPEIQFDDTKQGFNQTATGDMVIATIHRPLVSDLFSFYLENHSGLDSDSEEKQKKELFKITDVNFQRTSGKFNTYRLRFESAAINTKKEYPFIKRSYFYNNEFKRFYPLKYFNYLEETKKKDYLETIMKYYRPQWCIVFDEGLSQGTNLLLNKVLLLIKSRNPTNTTGIPVITVPKYNVMDHIDSDPTETHSNGGLDFNRDHVWYNTPGYVDPIEPDPNWKWTDSKTPNELALCIWTIMHLYRPFWNIIGFDIQNELDNEQISLEMVQGNIVNDYLLELQRKPNINTSSLRINEFLPEEPEEYDVDISEMDQAY